MPLILNVGLSRKTSRNYNSEGVSINLTAELDQNLLNHPDELQDRVAALYREAEVALQRQQNPGTSDNTPTPPSNGHVHGTGMTASQRRAIDAICQRLNTSPADEARHAFGLDLERMTIREASKFIDHLKRLQQTGNGHERGNSRFRSEPRTRPHPPQGNPR